MLRTLAKQLAKELVQILRKKWKIRGFKVCRDGSVKHGDHTFASTGCTEVFAWWYIKICSSPQTQAIYCPIFFKMNPRYLRIAEQVLPEVEKRTFREFLTLALISYILYTKFGGLLHDISRIRFAYDQYIEFSVGKWKAVGRKETDYYLRFPLVDEATEPDNYSVYFVIEGRGKTELLPIPYTQLLKLESEDFLRLAALTAL